MKRKKTIYELQAEVCKALANPKRLEILSLLKDGEKTVSELVTLLDISKASVSQHVVQMRLKGILKSRRDGLNIYYGISNVKVLQACAIMREVLTETLKEKEAMYKLVVDFNNNL